MRAMTAGFRLFHISEKVSFAEFRKHHDNYSQDNIRFRIPRTHALLRYFEFHSQLFVKIFSDSQELLIHPLGSKSAIVEIAGDF